MFLNNTSKIIRVEEDYQYILYVSDREECALIKKGLSPAPNEEIVTYGQSITMDNDLAAIHLPKPKFIHNKLSDKMSHSYHCFCCEGLGIEQLISHINPLNSWECLMNTLGNPDYIVIVKKNTDD